MLRLSEVGLFLVPTALFVLALVLGARTPAPVIWGGVALMVVMGIGTVWFGLASSLDRDERYRPAVVENGRIIEGHGTPARPP